MPETTPLPVAEDRPRRRARVLGYPIDCVTMANALAWADGVLNGPADGPARQVVTLNPEMILHGERHPPLGHVLRKADLALPDGAGVVWALRRMGYRMQPRVPGIEFSEALLSRCAEAGWPVAIIGAQADTLTTALERLQARFPGLQVAYAHHGFFQDEAAIAEACAAVRPRLVLAALGVPRQELWLAAHASRFPGAVLVGIGGSVDVWAGTVQRAPGWMRRLNMEWTYRVLRQPSRLRRIFPTLPAFILKVILSSSPGAKETA